MTRFSGLHFQKFDLHVHTPASHDFDNKAVTTAKDIVDLSIKKGLRGIAITDHHTGELIDDIKREAKTKELVVFPGVEICCTAGIAGIHIIAILSPEKGTKNIEGLLAALKIDPDKFGEKNTITEMAPVEVINTISNEPYNGIAILAHCTSSKGVLHDIKGETRKKIFESKGLLAVETSIDDFSDLKKKADKKRAIDILSGEDENYNFRKLGVHISSDSKKTSAEPKHNLNGIGEKYTFFKVDDQPDLESLRQCFIDRDVRIRQSFEYNVNSYPHIKSISINGGFFDKEIANFHIGLNSILGAKGSGKSLLVELLRFVLGKPSSQPGSTT